MTKKIMACLLAVACLLTAFATFALAEGAMKVIKCEQWVSLRQGPSTDTARLGQVPKDTVLYGCAPVEGSEWVAVNYEGVAGYIRGDFLEAVAEEAPVEEAPVEEAPVEPAAAEQSAEAPAEQAPAEPEVAGANPVENAPVVDINQPTEYNDDFVIMDAAVAGVRVIARQIFQTSNEYLMVVALDGNGNELWKRETTTGDISEMTQTDAFIGGTEAMPLVMMYNDWVGLTAIDPVSGEIRWDVPKERVFLGGSISRAVGGNGIAYIGGYYGPDPVAIDAGGNVLWQANSGDLKATWLYSIELQADGILCRYSSMAGEKSGAVLYDYNGAVKDVIYD